MRIGTLKWPGCLRDTIAIRSRDPAKIRFLRKGCAPKPTSAVAYHALSPLGPPIKIPHPSVQLVLSIESSRLVFPVESLLSDSIDHFLVSRSHLKRHRYSEGSCDLMPVKPSSIVQFRKSFVTRLFLDCWASQTSFDLDLILKPEENSEGRTSLSRARKLRTIVART